MYLVYVLAAIATATYFWSWGSERRLGWVIMATAMAAGYAGIMVEFGTIGSAIGAAWGAGLACMAIGLLGRTFYDQLHHPQPELSF